MGEGYDYHVMVLAPGMESAWFFQAAHRFWQAFHPIVTEDIGLLGLLPSEAAIAVTMISHTDAALSLKAQIEATRPDALLNMIVMDDLPLMESVLNARADSDAPFG